MNLTPVQIANQYRRCGMTPPEDLIRGVSGAIGSPTVPAKRGMNGLERQYAEHLDLQQRLGVVTWWAFEPMRLRLADGAYYKTDFLVQLADGRLEARETKGFERPAAILRFKMAAEQHPWLTFVMLKLDKGDWIETRRLNPA